MPVPRITREDLKTRLEHVDPAALLRGQEGVPVPLELDLVWETLGVPYAYRMTTRYEIPCRARGTIRLADAELSVAA